MTIHSVTFVHPIYLWLGVVLAAAVIALGYRLDVQRRAALTIFGSRRLGLASSLSRPMRIFKRALLVVAVLCGCAALARPQRGVRWEESHKQGIDLLFAIDTSKSMLAPDLKPDRLTRAKLAVRDLVGEFQGDRVGLVAFSGDAFLQCPLTLDRDMFAQTLAAVDTSIITRGGTDVGRAIDVSRAALANEPANQKLLVLLTDGEDLEAHALDSARAAGKDGVRIFTVGVGTHSGELIPVAGAPGTFMHDENGAFVRSRLDEDGLHAIAAATGGEYRALGADGRGLEALYRDVLAKLPHEALGSRMREVPLERYQWPLGLALLCFALEPLIRERRRRDAEAVEPPMRGPKFAVFRHRPLALLLLVGLVGARRAHASPQSAERAYHAGDFAQSAKEYEHAATKSPGDATLHFNLGAAAYKSGDFDKAGAALEHALRSDHVDLQENTYYDLGNTQYRAGQKTVEKEPEKTIEAWKKAIGSYESAIKLSAKDADAVYNRDLVKKKLAELEKKQQQKKKEQQAKNDQKKQDPKDQQGGKQPEDQQGQQAKNEQGQNGQPKDQQGQNGQPKNEQGQNGQAKNEQGQNGQPKDQQGQNGQPKDQQGQNGQAKNEQGQNGQPKDQQGQNGQQAQNRPGTAKATTGQPGDEQGDEKPVPGQLSRGDAKALLDSLRGDERLLPASTGKQASVQTDAPRKDW